MIRVIHSYAEVSKGIKMRREETKHLFSLLSDSCLIEGPLRIGEEMYFKILKFIEENFPESKLNEEPRLRMPIHEEENLKIHKDEESYAIRYKNKNLGLIRIEINSNSEQKVKDLANWLASNV
jgi:hypothetical protein